MNVRSPKVPDGFFVFLRAMEKYTNKPRLLMFNYVANNKRPLPVSVT